MRVGSLNPALTLSVLFSESWRGTRLRVSYVSLCIAIYTLYALPPAGRAPLADLTRLNLCFTPGYTLFLYTYIVVSRRSLSRSVCVHVYDPEGSRSFPARPPASGRRGQVSYGDRERYIGSHDSIYSGQRRRRIGSASPCTGCIRYTLQSILPLALCTYRGWPRGFTELMGLLQCRGRLHSEICAA